MPFGHLVDRTQRKDPSRATGHFSVIDDEPATNGFMLLGQMPTVQDAHGGSARLTAIPAAGDANAAEETP